MSSRTCQNKPAPDELPGYYVQDGWTEDGRRNLVWHRTAWNDSKPCGHTERGADPRCNGCAWQFGDRRLPSVRAQFEAECG